MVHFASIQKLLCISVNELICIVGSSEDDHVPNERHNLPCFLLPIVYLENGHQVADSSKPSGVVDLTSLKSTEAPHVPQFKPSKQVISHLSHSPKLKI